MGSRPGSPEFFGYLSTEKVTVTSIEYTEGGHAVDGGWIENGTLHVEVLIGGEWVTIESDAALVYQNGNAMKDFGNGYETFKITLGAHVECEGIRIAGNAGGSNGWVGVSELTVITAE